MNKEKGREKKLLQVMLYKDTHPELYDFFSNLPRGESAIRARDMMNFALKSGLGTSIPLTMSTNPSQEGEKKEPTSKLQAINPE